MGELAVCLGSPGGGLRTDEAVGGMLVLVRGLRAR